MRTLVQMNQDRQKLINYEFYTRTSLARRMYAKAGEILKEIDSYSDIGSFIHCRRYNKLVKQYKLCMAIGDRILDEASKWNNIEYWKKSSRWDETDKPFSL